LRWVRPTIFLAVPRIWEKFEDEINKAAAASGALT
jgi:long-subunit acyl-CoA synthetase (AMP-forming)